VSEETTPPPAAPLVLPTKPKRKGGFQKGKVSNPRGTPENLGTKMVLYRKRMAAAVPRVFNERQLERTLKILLEVRDNENVDVALRLRACDLILERMLGKAKVDIEVDVSGQVDVSQRLSVAKYITGLAAKGLEQFVEGEFAERDQHLPQLPPPAGEGAVRGEDAGDIRHPEQPEREGVHREFEPSPDPAGGAQVRTELGDAQEPEAPASVDEVRS
jgi:hypothetical protein